MGGFGIESAKAKGTRVKNAVKKLITLIDMAAWYFIDWLTVSNLL